MAAAADWCARCRSITAVEPVELRDNVVRRALPSVFVSTEGYATNPNPLRGIHLLETSVLPSALKLAP